MSTYVTKEMLKTRVSVIENNSKTVEYATKLAETIQAAGVPVSLMFEIEKEGENEYFRHYAIFLQGAREGLRMQINKREYDKQYSIFTYIRYEYCGTTEQEEIKNRSGLIEPQNIGVITPKKVQQHIEYQTALHDLYRAANEANKAKIEAFLNEVREYEKTFKPFNRHDIYSNGVRWHNDGLSGWIKNNGLEFTFKCHKESGYVEKKIKANPEDNDLSTFAALSSNTYTNPKHVTSAAKTVINNSERVFMVVWANSNNVFCNLHDLASIVKKNELRAGYYKIFHMWNNKPVKATKKLLSEMLAAQNLPFDFHY